MLTQWLTKLEPICKVATEAVSRFRYTVYWGELQDVVAEEEESAAPFLQSIPEPVMKGLTEKGFIVQVEEGALVTREGFGEQEMFLVLEGIFEVLRGGQRLALIGKGDLVGEMAFFIPSHRRSASVKAVTEGRVLAVKAKTLQQLIDSDPATAAQMLLKIGRVMAERLATMSAQAAEEVEEVEA